MGYVLSEWEACARGGRDAIQDRCGGPRGAAIERGGGRSGGPRTRWAAQRSRIPGTAATATNASCVVAAGRSSGQGAATVQTSPASPSRGGKVTSAVAALNTGPRPRSSEIG